MKALKFSAQFFLLATSAAAAYPTACGRTTQGPCRCPAGTEYSESVTVAVIGAPAKDVGALMNDFFQPGWLGASPFKTEGPDNTAGKSVRTTEFPTPIGVYNITESLYEYKVQQDGSFIQKFEQTPSTVPVEYHSGNGSFSGYWVSLEGTHIFQNETRITWFIWACETGHARNFAKFHEGAINNATSILTAAGKVVGANAAPVSAQTF